VTSPKYNPDHESLIDRYITAGWKLLELSPKTKQPVAKSWHKREGLTAAAAVELLEHDVPLGVQLGQCSRWLAAIDLDTDEARALAPSLLPATLTAGRNGVASHYYYVSEGADYQKFSTLEGSELLCIKAAARGQGHQIVIAPSRHPDGTFYGWNGVGFDPALIHALGAEELEHSVRLLAVSALVTSHLQSRGRHKYSLALAGHLLRRGVDEGDVELILVSAWQVKGTTSSALSDLRTNIRTSAEKLERGDPVSGYADLEEHAAGLPKRLDKYLGLSSRVEMNQDPKQAPPGSIEESGLVKVLSDAITSQDHFARDAGGRLYRFSEGCYRQRGERFVRQQVKHFLEWWGMEKRWSSYLGNEVVEYIAADAPELWIRPPLDEVNLENGILSLKTRRLRPHEPSFLSPVQIPVEFDKKAKCPNWDKFVEATFPNDAQGLAFELAADLMTPARSAQQAVLFLGEGSNGKSTFLRALTKFVGTSNTSGVSLHKLEGDKFATARLLGKLANICSDLPSTHLSETSVFKAITGGDDLHAEYKYRESFEFPPFCRLIFSANQTPRSHDASHAFFRRWVVVPFDRIFERSEQIPRETLDAKLADPKELSGVLNKALEVLPRIRKEGFTESTSMRAAWEEFKAMTDPVSVWVDKHTVSNPNTLIAKSRLLQAYNEHCDEEGRSRMTKTGFGLALKAARPDLEDGQRTVNGIPKVHCWIGLGLLGPEDKPPEEQDPPSRSSRSSRSSSIVTSERTRTGEASKSSKITMVQLREPREPREPYTLVSTPESVSELVHELGDLSRETTVGFDIETTSLSPKRGEIRLLQIATPDRTFVVDAFQVDACPVVEALSTVTLVVAHNAAFEISWVFQKYGIELQVRDTYLLARLLACGDMSVNCSLGAVVERELGVTLDKSAQTSAWSASDLTEGQLQYAALDAAVLPRLYETLTAKVKETGQTRVAEIEHAALPAVARMRLQGLPFDYLAWNEHAVEVSLRRDKLVEWIHEQEWLPEREAVPGRWALQGPDCLSMLKAAGLDVSGTTSKDLVELRNNDLVDALLEYRRLRQKGEDRELARDKVYALAPPKPPTPAQPWNLASPPQVLEIARLLGYTLRDTSESTLLRYREKHQFFRALLKLRTLSKQAGTYGPDWPKDAYDDHTGRLYPGWQQIGTSTGRFSSSSPNVQNLPRQGPYRSFFRAPEERTLIDVDYSQIELRVYAKLVNESALLEAYQEGADVYVTTAARLLRKPPSKVSRTERQKAKAIVLGLVYGLTARGLPNYAYQGYDVVITPREAETLVSRFFDLYPEIAGDHQDAHDELDANGSLDRKTIIGRRRDNITRRNEAVNMPVQGTAADGLKAGMAQVYDALREFEDAYIVGCFHDELLIECAESDGEEIRTVVEAAMVSGMDSVINTTAPHVPVEVEGTVSQVWSKD
jgi:P4 family phage/plasmid primase-like protien